MKITISISLLLEVLVFLSHFRADDSKAPSTTDNKGARLYSELYNEISKLEVKV